MVQRTLFDSHLWRCCRLCERYEDMLCQHSWCSAVWHACGGAFLAITSGTHYRYGTQVRRQGRGRCCGNSGKVSARSWASSTTAGAVQTAMVAGGRAGGKDVTEGGEQVHGMGGPLVQAR